MFTVGRQILKVVGLVVLGQMAAMEAIAQKYPARPIRILLGFAPGGAADVTTRLAAQKLSDNLGQHVVVDNRPGAAGLLAAQSVATATADGYTLLMLSGSDALLPALRIKLPYDLERDFSAVSLVATTSLLLVVHPSVPARTVQELVAYARAQAGKLSYGSSGVGGTTHFAMELFNSMAKTNIVHVPYKGGSEAINATLAGHIQVSVTSIAPAIPLLESGKLRPIAVTTLKRAPIMLSIPTIDESGLPGFDRSSWYGILAPTGVPKDVIARLNAVLGKSLNTSETKDVFSKHSLDVQTNTPEQFATFIHNEIAQNYKVVKLIGLKPQ